MFISGFIEESIVDGPGIRSVVFISGCRHRCKGCFNKQTWDFNYGKEFTKDEQLKIANRVKSNPLVKGLTLSGGDPVYSTKEVIEFIKLYKEINPDHNIWLYTGFTYEQILEDDVYREILYYVDVIVDSPFILEKKDMCCAFKGSRNQRIIDCKKSLKENRVVLYKLK